MSAHKLSKRLAYIRGSMKAGGTGTKTPEKKAPRQPGTAKERGDTGRKYNGVQPEWKQAGKYVFTREYRVPFTLPKLCKTAPLLGADIPAENCIFYDTETTGLSGGAGTLAFLIGTGRCIGDSLIIRQVFLADFPGEGEMLRLLSRELTDEGIYVSYNGKTFDSHLLRSRFLFHGMKTELAAQADLLYPARRLWKHRLPNCSLQSVEREVLGIERRGDIPGRDVPEYYFAFLKSGSFSLLEDVFRHNKQDIVSLAALLSVTTRSVPIHPPAARQISFIWGRCSSSTATAGDWN